MDSHEMNNQNGSANNHRSINAASPNDPLLGANGDTRDVTSSGAAAITHAHNGACAERKSVRIATDDNQNKGDDSDSWSGDGNRRHHIGLAEPPDGGWGWVVVLSSFVISMLVDGVCFSFGIFFDEFRSEFGSGKAATSWIGSVLNGTYLLIGPIVSALVNVYGCRNVAMSGAVLASFAFFISAYSNTLTAIVFTYGFLGGFGFGLMYLPAIVMVGYYFERRRALATGIACCGSGMGAFCFAPFTEYLIHEYGWRGSTWIISGLVLNGLVFALFYRPLPQPSGSYAGVGATDSATTVMTMSEMASVDTGSLLQSFTVEELDSKKEFMPGDLTPPPISSELKNQILESFKRERMANATRRTRSVTLNEATQPNDPGDIGRLARSTDFDMFLRKRQDHTSSVCSAAGGHDRASQLEPSVGGESNLSPLQRKDIFYSGSLMHLQDHANKSQTTIATGRSVKLLSPDKAAKHSANNGNSAKTTSNITKSFSVAISSIFDLSLLKSPTFLIYGMSCFLCMAGFFVPFIYMPTHAMDLGLDSRSAAILISIIGITNTVGRVGVGFVSDQPWADCLLINNVALMIGGTATIFVPYLHTYILLAVYAAVFGTSIAVFVSLRSIIMVELMGLERLTTAFGLVIMCQGMSAFLGAPIAGTLSDMYGNYNAAFYLAGISLALSGVICIPLRRIARWEAGWGRQRDDDDTEIEVVTDKQAAGKGSTRSNLKAPEGEKLMAEKVDISVMGSEVD